MSRTQLFMRRFDLVEYRVCRRLNQSADHFWVRWLFHWVSRLGDGLVWAALGAAMLLRYGDAALRPILAMAVTFVAGLVIYKWLKRSTSRERPFIRHPGITLAAPPLDRYSFPSGHTLHAVAFTWIAVANFPHLAWPLVPLAGLIAASRVVLGLHYPSDVMAGGAIGAVLAVTAQHFLV